MNITHICHKFNTEFHRWEVYGPTSVIRAGEPQPLFVAKTERECLRFIEQRKEMTE